LIELLLVFLKHSGINFGFFRLFEYLTFRALLAAMTALVFQLVFGHRMIVGLYRKKFTESGGEFRSIDNTSKKGTPTGGGIMLIRSTLVALLLWGKLDNLYLLIGVSSLLYFALVGLIDDLQKVKMKSSLFGLSQLAKTVMQLLYIVPFALFFVSPLNPIPADFRTQFYLPFVKSALVDLAPWVLVVFIVVAFFSIVNAVNITDGLDGLVSGPATMTFAVYGVFAYIIGNKVLSAYLLFNYFPGGGELVVFNAALVGALLGFIWYNTYPAEVFMGDTGSLALGGSMAVVAFLTRQEMLFPIVGGIFVVMIATSLIQEKIGNRLGRRLITRAPLHHSLTYKGIAEPKVVVRCWIISVLLAILAAISIKLR